MVQPIQIFGWIILVIVPVIFFVAIKPEKTAQIKGIKRIICFILMGIFALGVLSSLLYLLFRLPITPLRRMLANIFGMQRFLRLWGFRPAVTTILFSFFRKLPGFMNFYTTAVGRVIFPLLDLIFSAGMIFFFYKKANQLREGVGSLIDGENQFSVKNDSNGALDMANKIESKFSGGVLPIFLFCIWVPILLAISLGFATPFIICTVIRWICDNSSIGGKSYKFKGTAMGLFGRWILWYILTIITIGIYGFWATRNQIKWLIENVEMIN